MEYLISAFLGWIVSMLQGGKLKELGSNARYLISLLSCVLVGAIVTILQVVQSGSFEWSTLLATVGTAFATSQTYYNTYFKHK